MEDKIVGLSLSMSFIESDKVTCASQEEKQNPLLSWVQLVFTDDRPNLNKVGVAQTEFPNLISSMAYMPIKAEFDKATCELGSHAGAVQIGVIREGRQIDNSIVAVGALYNDEFPDVVDFFKQETSNGGKINFSWEIRYKNSDVVDGVEWLKDTVTKAITAVKQPAYNGRTPLLSISSVDALLAAIDRELAMREV
jgi:hypothetical protein